MKEKETSIYNQNEWTRVLIVASVTFMAESSRKLTKFWRYYSARNFFQLNATSLWYDLQRRIWDNVSFMKYF